MTKDRPRNMATSVRQRLMNRARDQQEELGIVLTRYGLERLLYRLSRSPYREQFVLKGAMLFQLWSGNPHRPTRDLDLLGQGNPDPDRFQQILGDICDQKVEDDGLIYDSDSVQAERMKEDEEYEGLRLKLRAKLGTARIPIQIDIGFGDAITPAPEEIDYPTLLDLPAPTLMAYPRETVVAEKFQAMVMLGIANSRMKDFYDILVLSQQFEFSGPLLRSALKATFERRKTALPPESPLPLTSEFAEDSQKVTQWRAFINKGRLGVSESLAEIVKILDGFLMPPTRSLTDSTAFDLRWSPGGPWKGAS